MKIRDSHARLNGSDTEHTMPSGGLDIIADDGRTLLCVTLNKDGSIHLSSAGHCKHNGKMLEDAILVQPRASNCVEIIRQPFQT